MDIDKERGNCFILFLPVAIPEILPTEKTALYDSTSPT